MNDAPACYRFEDQRFVKNRHVTDCRSRDCDGCVECEERHCVVCTRAHLEPTERQSCPGCVGRVRRDLIEVVDLLKRAGDELDGWPSASSGSAVARARSHEPNLPGGDTLSLRAGGSEGLTALQAFLAGDPHALDHELPGDPPSISHELARMEREWRRVLGHPKVGERDLVEVRRYLDEHLPEAIQHPVLFPDDARTIRRLRAILEAARRDSNRPMRGVTCFDCDTTLTRALRDPDKCHHVEPVYVRLPPYELVGPHGFPHIYTAAERKAHRAAFDHAYTAYLIDHMACDQGGFADEWECTTCGVTYDKPRYWRAVRQAHEDLQNEHTGTQEDAS